jgi:hypothetical protein
VLAQAGKSRGYFGSEQAGPYRIVTVLTVP